MATNAKELFKRRQRRVRHKLRNAGGRVRLSVHRSGRHIYAQLIDDAQGRTLASASTLDKDLKKDAKASAIDLAHQVGELIAKDAKVKDVAFDRGGYMYHGRVKALAEGARAGGLTF